MYIECNLKLDSDSLFAHTYVANKADSGSDLLAHPICREQESNRVKLSSRLMDSDKYSNGLQQGMIEHILTVLFSCEIV